MNHQRLFHLAFAAILSFPAGSSSGEAQEPPPGAELHVAPGGDDANVGSASRPFATLERARAEIRAVKKGQGLPPGGVAVILHGGLYELERTFELTAEDSGEADAPIVYHAQKGEEVRISGGKQVKKWQAVTDPAVVDRLDPAARGKVLRADLREIGVADFGAMGGGFGRGGGPGLELFFNDQPTTLSRYPNDGFIKITGVEGKTEVDVRGTKGRVEPVFTYEGDRPDRWKDENDAWVLGYWFWDWAEQRQRIESIDPTTNRMTLAKPYHGYGYRKGQWFYGFNLLCEIDQPGEWHLDRKAGVLYFWPPSAIEDGRATVSVRDSLVVMNRAHHVTLRGLTFEAARGTAIKIEGALNDTVVGCTVRNVGGSAVTVDGLKSGVVGCDVYATGDGGVSLSGGDRVTLEPAGLYAENNHIHHWSRWNRMYRHGVSLQGVGNRAAHNLLHDSPHTAVFFSGNDHVIELNEIHDVCNESNDAGAIYAGRDWTMRGTVIRHNRLSHIRGFENRGCVGVYLDDMYCGTSIFGNVFHDVTRAAFIGGGRDDRIENNIFVDCKPAVHVDSRALGWAHDHSDDWLKEIREKGTLSGVRYNKPPYSERYPKLAELPGPDPAAPAGTLIARNIFQGGEWDEIDDEARPFVTFQDNLLGADPHFIDAAKGNFQLRDDSPAYKLGFQRIPMEQIGLVDDGTRASWPAGRR